MVQMKAPAAQVEMLRKRLAFITSSFVKIEPGQWLRKCILALIEV